MRIGIDAKRLFFNYTGLGNYGRQFVHALQTVVREQDEILLFSPKSIENSPFKSEFLASNISNTNPIGINKLLGSSFWRTFILPNELSKNKIGIYYGISNELPVGIHKLSLKKVVIVHDLIFLRFPELYPAIDVFFYKKKTKYAAKVADRIIAVSEQTKQDLIDFYGISTDKIAVIPPLCDEIYYSTDNSISQNFHQSIKKPYCLNVGSITPRKNLLLALKAFGALTQKHDLDFVVVGTAVGAGKKYLSEIQGFIHQNGLENRVHFLGKVDKKQMPWLYQNAKFMVYPSQFEGFGMPIAESLAAKTPVITTKGGCFEEAGGPGALYVPANNLEELERAMVLLATDDTPCSRLANAGFDHVQQFRLDKMINNIKDFHQNILNT